MDIKKYFTQDIDEDTYGKICFRCIGVYDISALIQENLYLELDEKYFPFRYFPSNFTSYSEVLEYSEKHNDEVAWAYFVPFKEDNQNWKPEPHNSYYKEWEKNKNSLPIAIGGKNNLKKIFKWQQAGQGLFTPSYLDNIKSFEELKDSFDEILKSRNTTPLSFS